MANAESPDAARPSDAWVLAFAGMTEGEPPDRRQFAIRTLD